MHGPATVGWLLVALCALTGVSCLLRTGGPHGRRGDAGSEAVMGFAMAAMALPATWTGQPLPPLVFVAVFAVLSLRELRLAFAGLRGRAADVGPRHAHHLVGALAMVYMSLAMAAVPGGHAGHSGAAAGIPLLTGGLLAYFALYVLWSGARLMPAVGAGAGTGPSVGRLGVGCAVRHQEGVAAGCRLAMGTGMFAMLLTL